MISVGRQNLALLHKWFHHQYILQISCSLWSWSVLELPSSKEPHVSLLLKPKTKKKKLIKIEKRKTRLKMLKIRYFRTVSKWCFLLFQKFLLPLQMYLYQVKDSTQCKRLFYMILYVQQQIFHCIYILYISFSYTP